MRICCRSVPRIFWGIHSISVSIKVLSLCLFSGFFFGFNNLSFMYNKFGFFPIVYCECSFIFFLLLLLVDGDDVYVVVVVVVAAAAASGFVVVLAVLTR